MAVSPNTFTFLSSPTRARPSCRTTSTWRDLSMIEPMYLAIGLARKADPGETALVYGMESHGRGPRSQRDEGKGRQGHRCRRFQEAPQGSRRKWARQCLRQHPSSKTWCGEVMKETNGKGVDVCVQIDLQTSRHSSKCPQLGQKMRHHLARRLRLFAVQASGQT